MNIGWLTLLLLLPFVGAIATMLVPKAKALLAKQIALGFSLVTLVLTAVITIGFQRNGPADYDEVHNWIKPFGAHFALGLDGVGVVLLVLTALLTPVVLIASWNDAQNGRWSEKAFFALDGATRAPSPSAFLKCGGQGASPRPSASSRAARSRRLSRPRGSEPKEA